MNTLKHVFVFIRGPLAAGLATWVADVAEDNVWDVGVEVNGIKAAAAVTVIAIVTKLAKTLGNTPDSISIRGNREK